MNSVAFSVVSEKISIPVMFFASVGFLPLYADTDKILRGDENGKDEIE